MPSTNSPLKPLESCGTGCPVCGRCDDVLSERRNHWGICDTHRIKWLEGEGRYPDCRNPSFKLSVYLTADLHGQPLRPPKLPLLVGMSIDTILEYLWDAEEMDFDARLPQVERHIFGDLCLIQWWRLGLMRNRLGRDGGDGA